jgi:hypothetical protein
LKICFPVITKLIITDATLKLVRQMDAMNGDGRGVSQREPYDIVKLSEMAGFNHPVCFI